MNFRITNAQSAGLRSRKRIAAINAANVQYAGHFQTTNAHYKRTECGFLQFGSRRERIAAINAANVQYAICMQYNTIQLSFIPRPVYRYPVVLESATRESLLLQQSTFMPQHSVDFHSVRGSAALLNAHPKNSHALMFSSAWYPVYDPASRDEGLDRAL